MTTPALAENVKGRGRHYPHPVTKELVPSVTNVLSVMGKGDVLMRWASKLVAERAMQMKHALPNMDDSDIVDMLKGVPFARSKRASDRGTDIHDYLEQRMLGYEPPELSDDATPYKDAADAWLDWSAVEVHSTELTVFHPMYAGTVDWVGQVNDRWVIGDFKTSKAIYPEAALQLAALAGCYVQADGSPVPWRDADGEFIGIPELVVVRIGVDGFEEQTVADPFGSLRVFFGLLDAWTWKHEKAYL
jgi:hypothetical protein